MRLCIITSTTYKIAQRYSQNARKGEKVKIAERKWVHHYASRAISIFYIFTLVTHNLPAILHFVPRDSGTLCAGEYCTNILHELSITRLYSLPWQMYRTNTKSTFLSDGGEGGKTLFFRRAHQESFSSRCEAIVMNKTFRSLQFVPASTWLQNSQKRACPAII